MSESFVQLNNDGPGKKIDTFTESTNGQHRQVIVVGDPSVTGGTATVDPVTGVSVSPKTLPPNAAQETGGHLASIDSKTTTINTGAVTISTALPAGTNVIGHVISDSGSTTAITGTVTTAPPANASANITQVGGAALSEGQKAMAASVPVVIASDQSAIPISGTITTTPPANASTNITQISGAAITEGQTVMASSLPVVIASNQSSLPVTVGNFPATQPVSGTVTANQGTPAVTANKWPVQITDGVNTAYVNNTGELGVNVTELELAMGSPTAGQVGPLVQGAVSTAAPTYTTAQTNALSLTTAGALRVDGSAVTQPVSGTITTTPPANASTNITQIAGNAVSTAASGTMKVGIAGNTGAAMDAAGQNAASPANELLVAGQFNTTPTTLTSGNVSPLQMDAQGNLLVAPDELELAQGSTTAGQVGPLMQAAVLNAKPAYATATTQPLVMARGGELRTVLGQSIQAKNLDNSVNIVVPLDADVLSSTLGTSISMYGGSFSGTANASRQGYSLARTATIFKTVSVAATVTGNTAIWTPAAGNKFRILGFTITAQGLSATAAAAVTVSLQDAAVALGFGTFDVFVPTAVNIQNGVDMISGGWIPLGQFGILSSAANNVLNFNISAAGAGTAGTYRINVCGTEE
jgi:hypothetical protein